MNKDLKYIYQAQKKYFIISSIYALVCWDQETYMPEGAVQEKAEQIEYLAGKVHEKLLSKKLLRTVNKLKKTKLPPKDAIVIKILAKKIKKAQKIPANFNKKLAKQTALSQNSWEKAKKRKNFNLFIKELEKLVKYKKQEAKLLDPNKSPYDALLEEFEEGMTTQKLDKIFLELKNELIKIIKKIKKTPIYKNQKRLKIEMNLLDQEEICKNIKNTLGLNPKTSRLDISSHPFTSQISYHDIRITTRYKKPLFALISTIHESGHALYAQNLPKKFQFTFVCESPSLGIEESQSRFFENMIGKNKPFWDAYFKTFNSKLKSKTNKLNFYKLINQVRPNFIRTEADEISYPLHIILRYEIERDLINGKIQVKNLKKIWNQKFKKMFGITPETDNKGILQDVHWSLGLFGYFPTYAIGTIYAAQIYSKLKKEIPEIEDQIKKLDFTQINNWLKKNIHSKGHTKLTEEIFTDALGEGLNPKIFINYIQKKYQKIYKF